MMRIAPATATTRRSTVIDDTAGPAPQEVADEVDHLRDREDVERPRPDEADDGERQVDERERSRVTGHGAMIPRRRPRQSVAVSMTKR